MGEARVATVAELQAEGILLVEDGNHGEYRPRPDEFIQDGVAFIRAADMDAGRVDFDAASHINDRARRRITKGIGAPGDVLLSHKGTVGKVAIVPGDAPPFVCSPQTTFWRTLRPEVLDRGYLYAYLRSRPFHDQLASRAGETDMAPYVSLTSQRGLSVIVPPIDEQRRIAGILGALDDKIELNRRLAETLDAVSREAYRHRFVDGVAGADTSTLGDEFDVTMGQSPPGDTYNTDGIGLPFYQGRVDFGLRHPARRVYCSAPTRFARAGDTLLSVRAPVGDLNVATETCAIGRGIAAIRHRSGYTTYTFETLRALRPHLDVFDGEGTVFGSVGGKQLRGLRVVRPAKDQIEAFEVHVGPIADRLATIETSTATLTHIRDSLLPRLLSDGIEVSV